MRTGATRSLTPMIERFIAMTKHANCSYVDVGSERQAAETVSSTGNGDDSHVFYSTGLVLLLDGDGAERLAAAGLLGRRMDVVIDRQAAEGGTCYALRYPVRSGKADIAEQIFRGSGDPPLESGSTKLLGTTVYRDQDTLVRVFRIDGQVTELIEGLARAIEVQDVGRRMGALFEGSYDFGDHDGLRRFFADNLMESPGAENAGHASGTVRRPTVAVLGTGVMGHPIAQRLADTGHAVRVWNRTAGRSDSLTAVTQCGSPIEAISGADFILTVLADDAALTEVLLGSDGLLGRLTTKQLVLNFGTVGPDAIVALAAAIQPTGAAILDVGMLGNGAHAGEGQLRLYVGGPTAEFDRAGVLLQALAKEIRHMGAHGSGMAIKLVLNVVMGLEMQALAEATALAVGLGLDRSGALEVIAGSGFSSPVMTFKAKRMAAHRYARADFRLGLMAKDLRLAVTAAQAAHTDLPMIEAAALTHQEAQGAGWSDQDCAAIADALVGVPIDSIVNGASGVTVGAGARRR